MWVRLQNKSKPNSCTETYSVAMAGIWWEGTCEYLGRSCGHAERFCKAWPQQDLSQEVRWIHSPNAVDSVGKGGTFGDGSKWRLPKSREKKAQNIAVAVAVCGGIIVFYNILDWISTWKLSAIFPHRAAERAWMLSGMSISCGRFSISVITSWLSYMASWQGWQHWK